MSEIAVGGFRILMRCGNWRESGSEMRSVREYYSIYHNDILKGGLGAMPSGVYLVRLYINVSCVSLEWNK